MRLATITTTLMLLIAGCSTGEDANRIVGQLESDRVELTAEVSEPIVSRPVIEGQAVDAGHLVYEQDSSRIESRLDEARSLREQLRARLDELVRGPREERIVAAPGIRSFQTNPDVVEHFTFVVDNGGSKPLI